MSLSEASSNPAITPSAATASVSVVSNQSDDRFVERRGTPDPESRRTERRQFGSSHSGLSEDGRELALAIDRYKVTHHRRYLTCDEMLTVLTELGYAKHTS